MFSNKEIYLLTIVPLAKNLFCKNVIVDGCSPGLNEEYSICSNKCRESCKFRAGEGGVSCTLYMCQAGCFCKRGYGRDSAGNCVPISKCLGMCKRCSSFCENLNVV